MSQTRPPRPRPAALDVERGWRPVDFDDLVVGDVVRTLGPRGQVLAVGVIDQIVTCKDHVRAVSPSGVAIARSDYPSIYRRIR